LAKSGDARTARSGSRCTRLVDGDTPRTVRCVPVFVRRVNSSALVGDGLAPNLSSVVNSPSTPRRVTLYRCGLQREKRGKEQSHAEPAGRGAGGAVRRARGVCQNVPPQRACEPSCGRLRSVGASWGSLARRRTRSEEVADGHEGRIRHDYETSETAPPPSAGGQTDCEASGGAGKSNSSTWPGPHPSGTTISNSPPEGVATCTGVPAATPAGSVICMRSVRTGGG